MDGFAYHRQLDDAQLEAFIALAALAFATDVDGARDWIVRAGRERVRAVSLDGRVVGGLLRIPMAQYFGGRAVPTVGLAGVCVAMDARRRGVARRMLARVLDEARDDGFALSALYASNHKLYGSVGYAPGGSRFVAQIDPSAVDATWRAGCVRAARADNVEQVKALYEQRAPSYAGFLQRGDYIWSRLTERRRERDTHGLLLLADDGSDAPVGYVFFQLRALGEWQVLAISDAMACDLDGWRRVWGAVSSVSTMVRRIEWSTAPSDPLYLVLEHARAEMRLHENWMLRVVDVAHALRARGYSDAVAGALRFEVHDGGRDRRRYELAVRDGQARCEPLEHSDGAVALRLDLRGFAALYSGFASPDLLRQRGLLDGDEPSCATLGALLCGPAPWMREGF